MTSVIDSSYVRPFLESFVESTSLTSTSLAVSDCFHCAFGVAKDLWVCFCQTKSVCFNAVVVSLCEGARLTDSAITLIEALAGVGFEGCVKVLLHICFCAHNASVLM